MHVLVCRLSGLAIILIMFEINKIECPVIILIASEMNRIGCRVIIVIMPEMNQLE